MSAQFPDAEMTDLIAFCKELRNIGVQSYEGRAPGTSIKVTFRENLLVVTDGPATTPKSDEPKTTPPLRTANPVDAMLGTKRPTPPQEK